MKITKEHVFGDWLRELFPRDERTTHTHGVITWPDQGAVLKNHTLTIRPRQHGHSGSKKVGVVCRDCNEGWLSLRVEDPAKPILIPLVEGSAVTVTPQAQRLLATWAAKTVMTAENVNRGRSAVQQPERTHLKANLSPPTGWFIWAAPYNGNEWSELGIFQHITKLEIPSVDNGNPIEHNLGQTTIGLRHLLLIIRHSTWDRLWGTLGSDVPHVLRIWPPSASFSWPPPFSLSDADTNYINGFLVRVLQQPV